MLDADRLIGKQATDPAGDTVSQINTVVLDQPGKVMYVAAALGGFLGIDEKQGRNAVNDLPVSPDASGLLLMRAKPAQARAGVPLRRGVRPGYGLQFAERLRGQRGRSARGRGTFRSVCRSRLTIAS
jgi:hypothetical protein